MSAVSYTHLFPAARHGDIGDLLVLDHGIHGQSLVRGYKRLFLSPDILAGKERFDDGGTGGGLSLIHIFLIDLDAGLAVFQLLADTPFQVDVLLCLLRDLLQLVAPR